ncbi:hypothetical protein NM208_g4712 [Fusarium decemcellulare]|uniref:Uncharacterized protein n=1 Tax=Fusarium decemcellulare TaxID=57161 RepID=A0ACC1SJI8_9HYPO|nr:hypothetical protein NM208_g4712 [Fusarium decemcellulare]
MRAQSHLFGGLALLSGAWAKVKYLGVAIPGIDFGCDIDGSCPPDQAQYPSASHGHGDGAGQMKHFVEDSGLNTFRLPMTWQYILNEQVGGKLDDDKFGLYDDLMQSCLDTGAYCMIDLHNFARYDGGIIGQGGPSNEDFADVWSQLATKYAKEDKVMFGLMNEPHDLDVALWAKSCQAAVTSIRKAGATSQLILLPGTNFTNAETFVTTGSADALAAIKNPDGSKDGLILDLHKYLDINNSGSFDECTTDNVEAFRAMADWLRENKRVAIISESGASLSDSCMEKFCAQNEFIAKNSDVFIGFVGWGAGSFKYDYIMTLTPFQDGDKFTDNKLMKQCIIEPFIKNAPTATKTTSSTKTKSIQTQTTHTKPTKSTDSESSTESSDSSSTTEEPSSPSQPIFKEGSESAASRDSKPDDDSGASRSMGFFLGGLISLSAMPLHQVRGRLTTRMSGFRIHRHIQVLSVNHRPNSNMYNETLNNLASLQVDETTKNAPVEITSTSSYPPKIKSVRDLEPCDRQNELAALKDFLLNGLDPNVSWEEDDLVDADDDDSASNNSISDVTETKDSVADDSASNNSFEDRLAGEDDWSHWNTPLHRALRCSDFDSASLLIQHGADVNLCNYDDLTPLQEAVKGQRVEAVEYLVKNGADIDKGDAEEEEAPLQIALSIGAYEIFRLLVKAVANFSTPSHSQWTILDLAVLARDQEALEILLDCNPGLKPSPLSTSDNSKGPGEWSDNVTAKELLGIMSSNRLIPPQEFYEMYSHVILSTWYSKNLQLSTTSIKTFLNGLFEGLHEAAGMTIPTARTTLCQPCSSFQARIANLRNKERYNEPLFPVHDTRSVLDECAKHCRLCALAAEGLDNALADASGTYMYDLKEVDLAKLAQSLPSSSIGFRLRYEKASKSSDYHYRYHGCKRDHSYLTVVDVSTGAMNDLALVELDEKFLLEPSACIHEDTTTGSAPALSVARKWLDDCRYMFSHELCRKAYQHVGQTLPARVLELTGPPRLIEGAAMEGPYCALSYCWGESGVNTLTTQANLAHHMKGIPVDSLPIFIRESIHAARSLGYKYLWIDALCIVQDDEEDWGHEASRMSDIYSNSDLTISSLKAKDCDENLFGPRQIKAPHPLALDYWLPKQQRAEWTPGVVHQSPVSSRGWTLQEQILSPRMLYFCGSYIIWECLCRMMVDADPSASVCPPIYGDVTTRMKARPKCVVKGIEIPKSQWSGFEDSPWDLWIKLLEDFTDRSLSKSSDRIPAFLALSKSLEEPLGGQFIGGIWTGDKFLESLCWESCEADDDEPREPSWTWASVGGPVHYIELGRDSRYPDSIPMATVVSLDIQTNQAQSRVSGSITLKGTLHKLNVTQMTPDYDYNYDEYGDPVERFDHKVDKTEICYAFDLVGFERGPVYVEWGRSPWFDQGGRPPSVVRLLLQPVNDGNVSNTSGVFRRIGLCSNAAIKGQSLSDIVLPRKDGSSEGAWSGIEWSEADRVITIV